MKCLLHKDCERLLDLIKSYLRYPDAEVNEDCLLQGRVRKRVSSWRPKGEEFV